MLTSSPWATLLLALTLTAAPLTAAAAGTYSVQKGESLSIIAARLLGSADRWRELWALNPQIRTPKQLQPGTRLRLPDTDSRHQPIPAEAHAPEAPNAVQLMAQELIRSGHIDRMRADYRLLDTRAPESRIRTYSNGHKDDGEFLHIRGLTGTAPEGTVYGLFKPSPEAAGDNFVVLTRVGKARLALQQGDKARLRITERRQQALPQMQVLPMRLPPHTIRPRYPATTINARILKALYEQPGGYLLLLDRGNRSGVEPGHLLHYSKPDAPAFNASQQQSGGWMLVIDTSDDASLALVLQARQIPAVGDSVH